MTKFLRSARNLTIVNSLIARYLVQGYYMKRTISDPVEWRRKSIEFAAHMAKILLRTMHFEVEYNFSRPDLFSNGQKYFMVCNHMSYMDMAFLNAGPVPSVFVTSIEMRDTPFLGEISTYGGSYFVERRDRSKVPGEVKDLAKLMNQGFNVFVFPEGTSTHGMYLLPFKRALFTAAIEAQKDVLPICLRYEFVDGEPFSDKTKDRLAWYGDMGFAPHFLQVMSLKTLKVSVNYLDPISVKDFPDRHQLADQAFDQISKKYFENRDPSFKKWPWPPEIEARNKAIIEKHQAKS